MQKAKRHNKSIFTAIMVLLIIAVATSAFLGARVVTFALAKGVDEIVLTAASGGDTGTVENPSSAASFDVVDGKTVWETETTVDIFSLKYDNETGEYTVVSSDSNKVLAPGTTGSYNFKLCNTGSTALDYKMYIESSFTGGEYEIPVLVKVTDYNGKYLAGSESEWAAVGSLNTVSDSAALLSAHYMGYTLSWQWPFDSGNDEYDTLLGNLAAAGEDLTLTVKIHTEAEEYVEPATEPTTTTTAPAETTQPGDTTTTTTTAPADSAETTTAGSDGTTASSQPGGIPDTSDNFQTAVWVTLMVLSVAAIVFLLLYRRKDDKSEEQA